MNQRFLSSALLRAAWQAVGTLRPAPAETPT